MAVKGSTLTKETKDRISQTLTGRKRPKISEALKRYFDNEEVNRGRARLSLAMKGNKIRLGHRHSEETKKRLSKIMKGNKNNPRSRQVDRHKK